MRNALYRLAEGALRLAGERTEWDNPAKGDMGFLRRLG